MKKKSPAPENPARPGRISRYQRLLSLREKGKLPGPAGAAQTKPGAKADSYQIIAQAIRVMLREP